MDINIDEALQQLPPHLEKQKIGSTGSVASTATTKSDDSATLRSFNSPVAAAGKGKVSATATATPYSPTTAERLKMQRIHENSMTERPTDWLGGSAPPKEHIWHSPSSSNKKKASLKGKMLPTKLPLSPNSVTTATATTTKSTNIVIERPTDFLGGSAPGEAAAVSPVPHKTKLRTTWLKDMNSQYQSMPCVSDLPSSSSSQRRRNPNFLVKDRLNQLTKHFNEDNHKTEDHQHQVDHPSHFLVKDRMEKLNTHMKTTEEEEGDVGVVEDVDGGHGQHGYNKDGFLVQDRLSKLCKKSDENRHKNDELAVHPHGHAPTLHKKKKEEEEAANEKKKEDDPSATAATTIELQRDAYLAERPTGWLGGGEPTEETYHHNEPHHKARARPSWMMTANAKGSKSLRNVYSPPDSLHHKSSKIQEKLSAFEKGGN